MPRNTMDQFSITGVDQVIRNLTRINSAVAKPAVASGMKKGLRVIQKGIRNQIKKGVYGTNLYSVRRTIGTRFVRSKKRHEIWAKVGASVGAKKLDAYKGQTHGKHISKSRNAHWYFIGTPNRAGTQMWTRNPKPYPVQKGFQASKGRAWAVAEAEMKKVFVKKLRQRIKRKGFKKVMAERGKFSV